LFELSLAVDVLICVLAPILLARAILARYPVSWATVAAGAAAFVASQVVHIPFNAFVLPLLPGRGEPFHVPIILAFVGLSAGVCEETARYVALRWARPKDRSGPHALAFGAGHGGIESIWIGLGAAWALFKLLYIERVGVDQLGLGAADQSALAEQLAALDHLGGASPMLGALERLLVIPFHVAMTCLVMRAVAERRPIFLALAILGHALLDSGCVAAMTFFSPNIAEVWLAFTLPVSLAIIGVSLRRLPKHERPPIDARPPASGAPIELAAAEKTYGAVRALDGVTFTLAEGERACLLGPNGAGKTTSIRMITGAIAPSRGFVFLFGETSEDPGFLAQKRRVGIVPQQPGMYAEMTVRGYLAFVRELYDAKGTGDAIAEKLGLADVMDRATTALSGGMQRRLALAAALLPRPDLLVLDEPSAGLDPVAARQMIECVKEASAGRTTLLCTHNLAEAEELCDSVLILRKGKVLLHTRLDELRKTTQARIALRAQGDRSALVDALTKRGLAIELEDGEVRVPMADAERAAPGLLRDLLGEGLDVYECRIVRPTLEELFFQVVDADAGKPAPHAAKET
jgi:ABC-2 type transport system ATP-binding protein